MFNPIVSYLRSIVILEKHRALMMNIFRIPLNIILVILLILSKYFNPLHIMLFAAVMSVFTIIASIYLKITIDEKLKQKEIDSIILRKMNNDEDSPKSKEFKSKEQ